MKVGKHTKFMIDFISEFISDETDRYFLVWTTLLM